MINISCGRLRMIPFFSTRSVMKSESSSSGSWAIRDRTGGEGRKGEGVNCDDDNDDDNNEDDKNDEDDYGKNIRAFLTFLSKYK